jgi:hypothetical protein
MERKGYLTKLLTATINNHTWVDLSMAKVIAYLPGCYGSWVHWVLSTNNHTNALFLNDGSVQLPGLLKFANQTSLTDDISEELADSDEICRVHPFGVTGKGSEDSDLNSLQWCANNLGKTVYLYPDEKSIVWITNNQVDKIHEDGKFYLKHYFSKKYLESNNTSDILKPFIFKNHHTIIHNWPIEYDSDGILNKWIIREYLSLSIYDSMYKSLSIPNINKIKSLEIMTINIVDLRDNFSETIKKIAEYLEIETKVNDDTLNNLYQSWKDTQVHFYKDRLLPNIVNATINDRELSWSNLSIVDEAFIQYFLRQHRYEIKCHGLNNFPTNSKELRELIYAT